MQSHKQILLQVQLQQLKQGQQKVQHGRMHDQTITLIQKLVRSGNAQKKNYGKSQPQASEKHIQDLQKIEENLQALREASERGSLSPFIDGIVNTSRKLNPFFEKFEIPEVLNDGTHVPEKYGTFKAYQQALSTPVAAQQKQVEKQMEAMREESRGPILKVSQVSDRPVKNLGAEKSELAETDPQIAALGQAVALEEADDKAQIAALGQDVESQKAKEAAQIAALEQEDAQELQEQPSEEESTVLIQPEKGDMSDWIILDGDDNVQAEGDDHTEEQALAENIGATPLTEMKPVVHDDNRGYLPVASFTELKGDKPLPKAEKPLPKRDTLQSIVEQTEIYYNNIQGYIDGSMDERIILSHTDKAEIIETQLQRIVDEIAKLENAEDYNPEQAVVTIGARQDRMSELYNRMPEYIRMQLSERFQSSHEFNIQLDNLKPVIGPDSDGSRSNTPEAEQVVVVDPSKGKEEDDGKNADSYHAMGEAMIGSFAEDEDAEEGETGFYIDLLPNSEHSSYDGLSKTEYVKRDHKTTNGFDIVTNDNKEKELMKGIDDDSAQTRAIREYLLLQLANTTGDLKVESDDQRVLQKAHAFLIAFNDKPHDVGVAYNLAVDESDSELQDMIVDAKSAIAQGGELYAMYEEAVNNRLLLKASVQPVKDVVEQQHEIEQQLQASHLRTVPSKDSLLGSVSKQDDSQESSHKASTTGPALFNGSSAGTNLVLPDNRSLFRKGWDAVVGNSRPVISPVYTI